MSTIKKYISRFLPVVLAEAHCDIPCGIYDPTPAKIAAKTVQRMVMQLRELAPPKDWNEAEERLAYFNSVARRIKVKEDHAELVKRELQILWPDYFKPEHLEVYPDLHEKFWKALKLASKNKQDIDEDAAKELVEAVDEIAKIFYETKKDPRRFDSYRDVTDKLF